MSEAPARDPAAAKEGNDSPGNAKPRERLDLGQLSWTLSDMGRDPFYSLVTAFLFAPYFVEHLASDPVRGQTLWGVAIGVASILGAVTSPFLGAIADQTGRRKPWVFVYAAMGSLAMAGLWFAKPGASGVVALVMVLVIVAMFFADGSIMFTNAMLPNIASASQIGKLSGIGWALGFGASALSLIAFMSIGAIQGSVQESSWLWFDPSAHELERLSGVVSGVWLGILILPLLCFTPDSPSTGRGAREAISRGLHTLVGTLRAARHYRNILTYLIAAMCFGGGLIAFYTFTGVYAASLFDWDVATISLFGLVTTVSACVFSLVGGFFDDRFGPRNTLLFYSGALTVVCALMASVSKNAIGPFEFVAQGGVELGLLGTPPETFYHALNLIQSGLFGATLVSARSMIARIAPLDMMTEFFGLSAVFSRGGSFAAPLLISTSTALFASQRAGLFSVSLPLFALGFVILLFVREERAESLHDLEGEDEAVARGSD